MWSLTTPQVTTCTMTNCLGDPSMKAADRALVEEHWIKVAWICHTVDGGHPLLLFLLSRKGL
jgi:hypothetical protein